MNKIKDVAVNKQRAWMLTINNPSFQKDHPASVLKDKEDSYIYHVTGLEKGAEKGTIHYQIYIYFSEAVSFNKVKSMFPKAHIEAAIHSPMRCIMYCKKQENFVEYGSYERMIFNYLTF